MSIRQKHCIIVTLVNESGVIPIKKLLHMYEKMVEIRFFEEAVFSSLQEGLIHGTTHLCIGQEAVAVGASMATKKGDKFTSTHRGHGHSIAFGASLNKMMAEMYGKETGYCKGKGGSMHIADVESGNLGANGIVGGSIPIAVGSALTSQMKGLDYVTICFFGDGATNEGSFHEALNLAAIWNLPVVFICENNKYGMSTPIDKMVKIERLSSRANAYGFTGVTIDGNDVELVYETVKEAVEQARGGMGPTLIEAKTYRYYGHSKSDKEVYRTKEEVKKEMEHDPIKRVEKKLLYENVVTIEELNHIREKILYKVERAVQFAKESEELNIAALKDDVYA